VGHPDLLTDFAEQLRASADPEIAAAKADICAFAEYVMRDISGKPIQLQSFHREMLLAAVRERFLLINAFRGSGKALALNTALPTPSGWSTMGEVRVGDKLFDERGRPCRVIAVSEIMLGRPCYEITFSGGSKIVADAEHQWLTSAITSQREDPSPRTALRTTEELYQTQRVPYISTTGSVERNHRVASTEPIKGRSRQFSIHPYVLGAWLGDGSSANALLSCFDQDILDEIGKFESVKAVAGVGRYVLGTGALHPRRDSLQARLRRLGVLNNKHVPKTYLRASRDQRLALLQGLMDTDGSCDKNGDCEFVNTREQLARSVYDLAASLGFNSHFGEGRAMLNGRDYGPKYRVIFRSYSDELPVFRLTRKQNRLKKRGLRHRRLQHIIRDIRPVSSVPVRCIQVDSASGLFLAGEAMIPTHNSSLICYSLWRLMQNPDTRIMIVTASDSLSKEWLRHIESYMNTPQYIKLAGNLIPSPREGLTWTNEVKIIRGRSDAARGASLLALGVNGQIRGRRCDVVICDDLISEANSHTPYQRDVLSHWFHSAVLPTLDHDPEDLMSGQCIVVGTPLYDEDLMARLKREWAKL
jgi:hypothetical protein